MKGSKKLLFDDFMEKNSSEMLKAKIFGESDINNYQSHKLQSDGWELPWRYELAAVCAVQ